MSIESVIIILAGILVLAGVTAYSILELRRMRRQDAAMADLNVRLTNLGWRVE